METLSIKQSKKFLALGDSYTIGEGVSGQDSWPNQLIQKLKRKNLDFKSPDIIAKTGWTTRDLIKNINNVRNDMFDLISLLIGVNNQFQKLEFNTFVDEFEYLAEWGLSHIDEKGTFFIITIPDYGRTPYGNTRKSIITEEIQMYNDYIISYSERKNIPFVDVTRLSQQVRNKREMLAEDMLHYSDTMYDLWSDKIILSMKEDPEFANMHSEITC